MASNRLVILDVRDSALTPDSYVVVGVATIDDAAIRRADAMTVDEQTATGLRVMMRDHGGPARDDLEDWRQRYRACEHMARVEAGCAVAFGLMVLFAVVANIVLWLTGWDKYIP